MEQFGKGLFGSFATYIIAIVANINIAILVMVILIAVDFVTGVFASKAEGKKYDKVKAEKGGYKKLAMIFFWLVIMLLEVVLRSTGSVLGLIGSIPLPTLAATGYLIATETMSTFNNLGRMGFKVPDWFIAIPNAIKDAVLKDKIQ